MTSDTRKKVGNRSASRNCPLPEVVCGSGRYIPLSRITLNASFEAITGIPVTFIGCAVADNRVTPPPHSIISLFPST